VTGTLTGKSSTWPCVVAILMKPSRYNTHEEDTNRCLVSTTWFLPMITKTCTKLTVKGSSHTAEGTSQTVVGTSQIAVGPSQIAVGTSQIAVGTS